MTQSVGSIDVAGLAGQDAQRGMGTSVPQGWRTHQLPGLMGALGPLLSHRAPTGWQYGLQLDERHLNQAGVAHGGTLAALMDQALSALAWEYAGRVPCVTVQFGIQYLCAVNAGETLRATGRVTYAAGALLFLSGEMYVDDVPVASAQAVMKRLQGKP